LERAAGAWASDRALRRTHLSPDRLQRQLLIRQLMPRPACAQH
jgi:hypothetical protein